MLTETVQQTSPTVKFSSVTACGKMVAKFHRHIK